MGKFRATKISCAILVFFIATAMGASAQTFTTLLNFDGTDGADPYVMTLVQGVDGDFYGTTSHGGVLGGIYGSGTVFKITRDGVLTTLYSFCAQTNCVDGAYPFGGLVQANDGNFYGTTYNGGSGNYGTIFKITSGGTLTTLYNFCAQPNCSDGKYPFAALVQATDGNLYGSTQLGGTHVVGTLFKISLSGELTTLHSFNGADGGYPEGKLLQAGNGILYGTTVEGGGDRSCMRGCGTIFKLSLGGALTTLHSFDGSDGSAPIAGLAQGNGFFYGTTSAGGASAKGTIFKVSATGALTTLHSFDGTDGSSPYAGLVQATDRTFYGATSDYSNSNGTVFRITPGGTLTTIHSFDVDDGQHPFGGLVQGADGSFYGTTYQAGSSHEYGTVFSFSVGLGGSGLKP